MTLLRDIAIGDLKLRLEEYLNMTYGEFKTLLFSFRIAEFLDRHRYRNILAALLHEPNPKRLFYITGDNNDLPELKSSEENIQELKNIGLWEIFKQQADA